MASSESNQLHFILFPYMAQGHLIPMFDIARLLAQHQVLITIVTTPINANRFRQILDRELESVLQINLVTLKFPAEEAGLPQDCENLDLLSSLGSATDFNSAINLLEKPAEKLLQEMIPRPTCIISDMTLPFTGQVAAKLGLPRISFSGSCCFYMSCVDRVYNSGVLEGINSETEYFSIPGLPHPIQITKQQLPGAMMRMPGNIADLIKAAEEGTYGVIMNSFEELEPEYAQECKKIRVEQNIWCIGPVSLTNKDNLDLIQRGNNKVSIDKSDGCLKWLDENNQVL